MKQLNELLKKLVSSQGEALHLEPNKSPYVTASEGNINLSETPLQGAQISVMVFALMPPDVQKVLPNQDEVHFVHPHTLGKFSFLVKKSSVGFRVSITPVEGSEHETQDVDSTDAPVVDIHSTNVDDNASWQDQMKTASREQLHATDVTEAPEPRKTQEPAETEPQNEATSENSADKPEYIEAEIIPEPAALEPQAQNQSPANIPESAAPEPQVPNQSPANINEPIIETLESHNEQNQMQSQTPIQNQQNQISLPQQPTIEPSAQLSRPAPNPEAQAKMDALFRAMAEAGASDLHMSVSMPPMMRKDGKMAKLDESQPELTPETMQELLNSIMPQKNIEEFAERKDTDFAYEISGLARFRANIFMDRKGMGGVFRIIPSDIMTAEDLNLSKHIMDLCDLSKGLVVVTGPTGSGKSTTLCAMVDSINKNREDHIITIEDPIEFTHENQKCLVNQREVHNHTDSFKDALRAALREDPDILLVGEMRDLETISIAIETAETGHLVFGTLHTSTAASTVDRIIDQFPADRQQQVRVMLSESLRGVIAQTLLPKKGGGRVAALEVLIVTPAISNLIREGKTFQIPSAMQTGKSKGMVMLNDALMELVTKGIVEPRDAYIKAVDKTGFEMLLSRKGLKM